MSNACKFTTTGEVKIVTKLLYPRTDASGNTPPQSPSREKVAKLGYYGKHQEDLASAEGQNLNEKGRTSLMDAERHRNAPDPSPSDSEKTLMEATPPGSNGEDRPKIVREGVLRDLVSSGAHPAHFGVRIPNKPIQTKAIIRVEVSSGSDVRLVRSLMVLPAQVHDTGVGLHNRDVIE